MNLENAMIMILMLLSYLINSACDAIDHAKGGSTLMELWHILKAISYGIPFSIILYLIDATFWLYPVFWLALWIWWEFGYNFFRALEIWRYDDKLVIKWLRKLWGFGL